MQQSQRYKEIKHLPIQQRPHPPCFLLATSTSHLTPSHLANCSLLGKKPLRRPEEKGKRGRGLQGPNIRPTGDRPLFTLNGTREGHLQYLDLVRHSHYSSLGRLLACYLNTTAFLRLKQRSFSCAPSTFHFPLSTFHLPPSTFHLSPSNSEPSRQPHSISDATTNPNFKQHSGHRAPAMEPATGQPAPKRLKPNLQPPRINEGLQFFTPPASGAESSSERSLVPPSKLPTLDLSLQIPKGSEAVPKTVLAARKGAANRWRAKLVDPPPDAKELKKAYPCKLLRHYPSTSNADTVEKVANPITPQIQKSARVTNLLRKFPALAISTPLTPGEEPPAHQVAELVDNDRILRENIAATSSMEATKLAWSRFSEDRERKRRPMVESALYMEDLEKEYEGVDNRLPEWRKWHTSQFLSKTDREDIDRQIEEEKARKLRKRKRSTHTDTT
ncbi:hypothetical protein K504DRAFT_499702 [Pleomassaria siparia CBS 279.74]|uniref:Uncharacterized protein n=1 Tax=Pleomassaria siparia CBS 279.74 TaxID=1314801 RepID=A0A6G1KIF8_9PLEO|nr:hypothetical protein K504DRAFT_499702 [Pleomassaria siparia CBS 279.74]